MKQAFVIVFTCAALVIAMSASTTTANAACTYQACFNKCIKNGKNDSSRCARGCARICTG
jgi:hypothetical protein